MLQEDLEAAKALFHADGDGLPADQIGNLCKVRSTSKVTLDYLTTASRGATR